MPATIADRIYHSRFAGTVDQSYSVSMTHTPTKPKKASIACGHVPAPFTCVACSAAPLSGIVCAKCGQRKRAQSFRRLLTAAQAEAQGYLDHAINPRHTLSKWCKECQPGHIGVRALAHTAPRILKREVERGRLRENVVELELERRRVQARDWDVESVGSMAGKALAEYRVINRWAWWRYGDRMFMTPDQREQDKKQRQGHRTRQYLPLSKGVAEPTIRGQRVGFPLPAHPWYNPMSIENQLRLINTDVWRYKKDKTAYGQVALAWSTLARQVLRALGSFGLNALETRDPCGPDTVADLTLRKILLRIVMGEPEMHALLGDDPVYFLNQRWRQRVALHIETFNGKHARPLTGIPRFLAKPDVWIFEDMPGASKGVLPREDMRIYNLRLDAYEQAARELQGEDE